MAYLIVNECINCRACKIVCHVDAIIGPIKKNKRNNKRHKLLSYEHYFIDQEKCDECILFIKPKCSEICPMNAIKKV